MSDPLELSQPSSTKSSPETCVRRVKMRYVPLVAQRGQIVVVRTRNILRSRRFQQFFSFLVCLILLAAGFIMAVSAWLPRNFETLVLSHLPTSMSAVTQTSEVLQNKSFSLVDALNSTKSSNSLLQTGSMTIPSLSPSKIPNDFTNSAPASLIVNASDAFTERWCDMTSVDWFPHDRNARSIGGNVGNDRFNKGWQQRVPALLLPGAKYTGTHDVAFWLERYHSQIIPARAHELRFFYESNIRRYVNLLNEKTKVFAARERMYARDFTQAAKIISQQAAKQKPLSRHEQTATDGGNHSFAELQISLDATSGYLFSSSILPRRLLCVMPWVRFVIVLRDPVHRVAEHYMAMKERGLQLSLQAWVEKDLHLMSLTGLLQNTTLPTKFAARRDEDVAWYEYQTTTLEGAIGRSIYCIQLRHWFQALRAAGRNPSRDVLILRTEDLFQDPQKEFMAIIDFLQLRPLAIEALPTTLSMITVRKNFSATILSPTTQKTLQNFFQPYNHRLMNLLKRYDVSLGGAAYLKRSDKHSKLQ